jgi:hypothetical protein
MEHPNEPDGPGPADPDPDEHDPDAAPGAAQGEDGSGTEAHGRWEDL